MIKIFFFCAYTFLSITIYAQTPVNPKKTATNRTNQKQAVDTVPTYRPVNTITHDARIILPFVLSIPAEAFRASNGDGNNGFYKIRRDGLGTMAGNGETLNNTLVAPLQLPDGAVIKKIEFNALSLYPHGHRPHLRLVQRGLIDDARQQGGYKGVTKITNYSASSFALISEKGGLMDIKTIKTENLNYKINNKTSSYYFEVLANKSDIPPADVRGSYWPNDNQLFIWSVTVFYTAN